MGSSILGIARKITNLDAGGFGPEKMVFYTNSLPHRRLPLSLRDGPEIGRPSRFAALFACIRA